MNSETLIGQAGAAIVEFQRLNNCNCYLYIENSAVRGRPLTENDKKPDRGLIITQWQQQNGLTSRQWKMVGTSLFNQYNREVACRLHQKR
jgi:hypothetical protein